MTRECERPGGINLGQGLGDLPTPPLVRGGAIKAIPEGRNTYTPSEGVTPSRLALAEKLMRDNGLDVDPEKKSLSAAVRQVRSQQLWIKQFSPHVHQASLSAVPGVPAGFQYALTF
jgi:hypothetical protein